MALEFEVVLQSLDNRVIKSTSPLMGTKTESRLSGRAHPQSD